jgi:cholesterol transport system auxiliary component
MIVISANEFAPAFPRQISPVMRHILAVALMMSLAACGGGSVPTTFDLSAPNPGPTSSGGRSYIVVAEPTTVQALDSDRIIVKDSAGAISFLGTAQWADRVPKLVQTRLIQTFENASRLGRVGRPGDRIVSDLLLNTDIRSFTVELGLGEAVVEATVKLVNDKTGRVRAAKLFVARVPLGKIDGPAAAQAMDVALSRVLVDIVRWAGKS